ncbi:hypothetical protein [Plectonema radiosum]
MFQSRERESRSFQLQWLRDKGRLVKGFNPANGNRARFNFDVVACG